MNKQWVTVVEDFECKLQQVWEERWPRVIDSVKTENQFHLWAHAIETDISTAPQI